jgi:hypothetical protein
LHKEYRCLSLTLFFLIKANFIAEHKHKQYLSNVQTGDNKTVTTKTAATTPQQEQKKTEQP